jgi:type II secretory pathway component PulJ
MMRRGARHRRGLTLFEVLVSISLVGALLGAMFAFFFDMLDSRRRALDDAARQLAATLLVERLEAALATCIAGDAAGGAGVKGDATSLRIRGRSVAAHLAERGLQDPEVLGDLQAVEYRFQAGRIEGRRVPAAEGAGAEFAPLGPAGKLRFRYHDGSRWLDSYDSLESGALPIAVEVAVWSYPLVDDEPAPDSPDARGLSPLPSSEVGTVPLPSPEPAETETLPGDSPDEPLPDRLRVILVPDAAADDPYAASAEEGAP